MSDVQFTIDAKNRGALAALRGTREELRRTETQARHTGTGFRHAEQDLGRATRGAIAGTGAFHHLGRSIAFASGAFLGAAGFVSAVRKSLDEAIDLNTQIARSNVVFGSSAKEIQAWSKTTEQSISLAAENSLKAANDFGTMLTAMGLAPPKAAELAKEMTHVAAAISLARGEADPSAAVKAITVALAGRGRALRQYGIVLDEANLKAEALRLGLVKTSRDSGKVTIAQNALNIAAAKYADALAHHSKNSTQVAGAYNTLLAAQQRLRKETAGHAITLTNAQKAQAASNLVLQQGRRFTDQYGKLLNTTAGRQRRFNEGVQNLREELGTAMLPAFNRILDVVNRYLTSLSVGGSRHAQFERALRITAAAARSTWHAIQGIASAIKIVIAAVGGWKTAFELIIGGLLLRKLYGIVTALKAMRLWTLLYGTASSGAAKKVVAASATEIAAITAVEVESTALMTLWAVSIPAAFALATAAILLNADQIKKALADLYTQSETPVSRVNQAGPVQGRVFIPGRGFVGSQTAAGQRFIGRHPQARVYPTPPKGDLGTAIRIAQQVRAENANATNAQQERAIRIALTNENFSGHVINQAIIQTRPGTGQYGAVPARSAQQLPSMQKGGKSLAGFAAFAKTTVGTPYKWGGNDPFRGGADCSGLVRYLYAHYWGITLGPRTSQGMFADPKARKIGHPTQVGDLIFYHGIHPGHVTMYLGNGKMIEDPHTGANVFVGPVRPGYVGVRRYLPDMAAGTSAGTVPAAPSSQIPAAPTTDLTVDRTGKKKKKPRYADPETIKIEDRRIREEEAAIRRAARLGYISDAQAKRDIARLERLRKALHKAHLTPAEERDIADRTSRLWRTINKTIQAGAARARKHAAELAKAHKEAVDKAEREVNVARDRLGRAWDLLASRALEAFDRVTRKGEDVISASYDAPTPAEQALAALQKRRTQLAQASALADAQSKLDYARAVGDPLLIRQAQDELEQAQLDSEEEGLQARADAERKARDAERDQAIQDYEDMRQIQRDKLDAFLTDLKEKLDAGTITWKDALADIKGFLSSDANLGDFGSLGALIGQTFTQGLLDALVGAGGASEAVDKALRKLRSLGYVWNPETGDFEPAPAATGTPVGPGAPVGAQTPAHTGGYRTPGMQAGGVITRPMLIRAGENFRKEGIVPLDDPRAMAAFREAFGTGGGDVYHLYFPNYVGSKRELAETVRSALNQLAQGLPPGRLFRN